jgi:predicted nucleic acid-binding Zn ribbon protein
MGMSQAKPISQLIRQFIESIGIGEKIEENFAIAYWDKAVGKEISEQTEPFKITDGVLFVKVADPAWRNELQFLKAEIITKLNKVLKKNIVKDIKFY